MPSFSSNSRMQHTFGALLVALGLLAALLALAIQPVQAQQGQLTGLDLVFVIDQSGSMGGLSYGSADHPLPNDPNDLRFEGVQELVDRLGSYRLNYYPGSDKKFQTAVVYFGSTTEVIVPATIIDPDTADQWEPLRLRLTNDLSADAFRRNLGSTNHIGALQQAKSILQQMERTWQGGRHTQAIFMLTDGEWYLGCPQPILNEDGTPQPIVNEPAYCRNGDFQYTIYRTLLDEYVQTEIWPENYQFYLGAINDRDPQNETWSRVRTWWERWTQGNAELLQSNLMWVFFEQILAELTVRSIPPETSGTFLEIPITQTQICLNPYLSEVIFIIHKPDPKQRISLYQEDGQLLDNLSRTITEDTDKFIEKITIHNPDPGCITIERPVTAGVHHIFIMVLPAIVSCDSITFAPQFIPLQLRCTITSQGGSLPPYKDPKYDLDVVASFRGPGTELRLSLVSPQLNGVYTGFFLPSQTGIYEYNLLGSTRTPSGQPLQFFGWPKDGTPATFTVAPTSPRLQPVSPPTALVPTTVNVALVDAGGAPLQIPAGTSGYVHMQLSIVPDTVGQPVELSAGASGYEGAFIIQRQVPTR